MLPGGMDSLYRSVLGAAHTKYTRVEVWSGTGIRLDTTIPEMDKTTWYSQEGDGLMFLDGVVQATLSSRVARNLTLSVPSYMYPVSTTDLLAPFGNELRVYSGVRLGDGSLKYVWQVFRGRIRDVVLSSTGTCSLRCSDRAADVQDVGFVSPQNSVPTNTINQEWQRLISDAVPDATFGPSDGFIKLVEPMTWEFERASALDEMTRSVSAVWYPLANGDFVLRRFPWTVASAPVVVWSDRPGGIVNAWQATRARDSIFNVVTVTGERLNGDAPVYATESDTGPGSPTSINGSFGVRSRVERLQNPSTQGGAASAAQELLRTYIAPIEEWTLSMVPDAALELGDTGLVQVEAREVIQVTTGFSLPLGVTGDMTVSTRSVVVGGGV